MSTARNAQIWALLVAFICTSLIPVEAWAADFYKPFYLLAQPFKAKHREEPVTCEDPAVEQLANQIDWLEHYIDDYGTIVAKHPDVWGESRLARHRDEYEREMAKQLGQFTVTMNASLRRSDQAFLGMAMALQSAAQTDEPRLFGGRRGSQSDANVGNSGVEGANAKGTEVISNTLQVAADPNFRSIFTESADVADDAAKKEPALFWSPKSPVKYDFEKDEIALEPTIELDQRSRYLRHLNHLRRINEGDDTADSPGYALNLVRIPISVLPGKKTRTGYGAEITITAESYLTDSLLPTTFRNLVVNDLVDQLSWMVLKRAEILPELKRLEKEAEKQESQIDSAMKTLEAAEEARKKAMENAKAAAKAREEEEKAEQDYAKLLREVEKELQEASSQVDESTRSAEKQIQQAAREWVDSIKKGEKPDLSQEISNKELIAFSAGVASLNAKDRLKKVESKKEDAERKFEGTQKQYEEAKKKYLDSLITYGVATGDLEVARVGEKSLEEDDEKGYRKSMEYLMNDKQRLQDDIRDVQEKRSRLIEIANSQSDAIAARSRVAPNALPPTQIEDVLGHWELEMIVEQLRQFCGGRGHKEEDLRLYIHLHDARQFIQAEVSAAYDLLRAIEDGCFMVTHVTCLAEAIRANDMAGVQRRRKGFFAALHKCKETRGDCITGNPYVAHDVIEAFAWAIVVESALLNKRLIRDINEAAQAKGCCCVATEDMKFYLFEPMPQRQPVETSPREQGVGITGKQVTARKQVVANGSIPGRLVNFISDESEVKLIDPNPSPQPILNEKVPETELIGPGQAVSVPYDTSKVLEPESLDSDLEVPMEMPQAPPEPIIQTPRVFCDPICEFKEATRVFQEYVKCRWPIRVFALDPVVQEQNVAEAFARRRELQIAMSLAFASGKISGQALMRFARQLEWDLATISLNRTVVGFSHGSDTFGWRFQPRIQTPPIKSNLAAFGETLFGGPTRDQDLRDRQLEPGIRECTAIVVMPSFVPYALFDVRTNWYKLTNPKMTEISMRETMRLSRAIQAMKNSAAHCSQCAHLYRHGEVRRLFRRVDQLDRELPLQSMMVQIPYENTLGGFELFNRGITDLAPEIVGWYGARGINPRSSTKLFLVGDGFSVLGNKVIAGGCEVPFRLISRQVMEVTIPPEVQIRGNKDEEIVDVYTATPYGVSRGLMIPVDQIAKEQSPICVPKIFWKDGQNLTYWYKKANDARTLSSYYSVASGKLRFEYNGMEKLGA